MNYRIAYRALRCFSDVHSHIKNDTAVRASFRFDNVESATATAIQASAKSALTKGNLSRQLDLKTKCGAGTMKDVLHERSILQRLAESKEPETDQQFESDVLELMNFWQSLRERSRA